MEAIVGDVGEKAETKYLQISGLESWSKGWNQQAALCSEILI